jgi:hypothetical protein
LLLIPRLAICFDLSSGQAAMSWAIETVACESGLVAV